MNYKKERKKKHDDDDDDGEKDGGNEKKKSVLNVADHVRHFLDDYFAWNCNEKVWLLTTNHLRTILLWSWSRSWSREQERTSIKHEETRVNTYRRLLPLRDRFLERRGDRDRERVLRKEEQRVERFDRETTRLNCQYWKKGWSTTTRHIDGGISYIWSVQSPGISLCLVK